MYQIFINPKLGKRLAKYPASEQKKLKKTLKALTTNPLPKGKNLKKLQGKTQTYWRIRIGEWRIIYHFEPKTKIIQIIDIDLRVNIY